MIKEKDAKFEEQTKEVPFVCPECKNTNKLDIPVKIINQSKRLTTISIPAGLICEHSFQAFVDKDFKVRGYQKVDYELSKVEFLEGGSASIDGEQELEDQTSSLSSLPLFKDIINVLRSSVNDEEILGTGLFTIEGKVLYSSLPQSTLFHTIKEFEVREKKNLVGLKKMLLHLENDQKVCSQYMTIYESRFILVVFFSQDVKLGMGTLLLSRLAGKIEKMI